jgi:hypothetical protein
MDVLDGFMVGVWLADGRGPVYYAPADDVTAWEAAVASAFLLRVVAGKWDRQEMATAAFDRLPEGVRRHFRPAAPPVEPDAIREG